MQEVEIENIDESTIESVLNIFLRVMKFVRICYYNYTDAKLIVILRRYVYITKKLDLCKIISSFLYGPSSKNLLRTHTYAWRCSDFNLNIVTFKLTTTSFFFLNKTLRIYKHFFLVAFFYIYMCHFCRKRLLVTRAVTSVIIIPTTVW